MDFALTKPFKSLSITNLENCLFQNLPTVSFEEALYLGNSGTIQVNPDKLIRFRVNGDRCLPRYICYAMNAEPTRARIEEQCATTAGNIGISASKLKETTIPVPPLTEQRRIVAKVDELMALVNNLEQQQTRREELAAAYAQSAVSALTGTEFKPKAEKMKAPKTELISLVRLRANPDDAAAAPLANLLAAHNDELEAKTLWQRSGLPIEDFYQQLKKEIAAGYIQQPEEARLQELPNK